MGHMRTIQGKVVIARPWKCY